jgi:hypothetical protein
VAALRVQAQKWLDFPHQFWVLNDVGLPACDGGRSLVHNFPGWWSKLELFKPEQFADPVLYFDLDTMLIGPIREHELPYDCPFAMLGDFHHPGRLQSGIMWWYPSDNTARLWDRFFMATGRAQARYRGDGEYLYAGSEPQPERLQDLWPGKIVSYKRDVCLTHSSAGTRAQWVLPGEARVICFHGHPRPWESPLWGVV